MKRKTVLVTVAMTLFMIGCAQKKVISPNETGSTTGYNQGNGSTLITGNGANDGSGSSHGGGSSVYQNVDPYGEGYGSNGNGGDTYSDNGGYAGGGLKSIYFNLDQYTITADKLPIVSGNVRLIKPRLSQGAKLKLEGHCDASGSDEYNYALGLRRAKSTKDALVMKGIPEKSIALVSMGESSPECASSGSEGCYSKNRRVEFKIVQ